MCVCVCVASREAGRGGGRVSWPNIYPDLKILSVFSGSQYILKYRCIHSIQSIFVLFVMFVLLFVQIANTCIKNSNKNLQCCKLSE